MDAGSIPRSALLISGLVLTLLWAVVLFSWEAVFVPGPWLALSLATASTTTLTAAVLAALRPSFRTAAALGGAGAGLTTQIVWMHSADRFQEWASPSATLDLLREEALTGVAPMTASAALSEVIAMVVLLLATVAALIFVGLGSPLMAGAVLSLLLLVPYGVTGISAGSLALVGAGICLGLLTWLGSPRRSLLGLVAVTVAVGVAATVLWAAPRTQDRVWNSAIAVGPLSGGSPDVTITLAEDLRRGADTVAFSYVDPDLGPLHFRLATLADFEDGRWLPQDTLAPDGLDVSVPRADLVPPRVVDASWDSSAAGVLAGQEQFAEPAIAVTGQPVPVDITIQGLISDWLPLPAAYVQAASGSGDSRFVAEQWKWTQEANTARSEGARTQRGQQYTAAVLDSVLSQGQGLGDDPALLGLLQAYPHVADAPSELRPYLALPGDLPQSLAAVAAEMPQTGVDGQGANRVDIAVALQQWFRGPEFVYDESAPYAPGANPEEPFAVMEAFLQTKAGFCVHYASAFAVLARSLGVPTRVAVGYVGRGVPGQEQYVSTRDLHAWPEVYIDDIGWLPFEPTPGGAGYRAETGVDVDPIPASEGQDEETAEPGASEAEVTGPQSADVPQNDTQPDVANEGEDEDSVSGRSLPTQAALLVLAMILLVAATPAAIRWTRKVSRLQGIRRLRSPYQRAWAELRDTAMDLGLLETARLRAQTPEATVEYLQARGAFAGTSAVSAQWLAAEATAERYGKPAVAAEGPGDPQTDAREEASHALRHLRTAVDGLSSAATSTSRTWALVWPQSVVQRSPRT